MIVLTASRSAGHLPGARKSPNRIESRFQPSCITSPTVQP
jgi:hypothetical protein